MPRVNGYAPGRAERLRALRVDVERGVQRLDFVRRIGEADVAQLALLVSLAPLGDLGAQPLELGAFSGGGFRYR